MSNSPADPPPPSQPLPSTGTYAPPSADPWTRKREEFLAYTIVGLLPRGTAPERHRDNLRRLLDTMESGHRELGLLPPAWLGRARELHLAVPTGRNEPPISDASPCHV